jgi:DNA-binding transcriptional LysR family regulator
VTEGYDAAIRLARLPDSSLGTIRLGTIRPVLAASRTYLDHARALRQPSDLRDHAIVGFGPKRRQTWRFTRGASEAAIDVMPRAVSNNATLVAKLCAGGAGLSLIPRFTALEAELEIVEPGGWSPQSSDFSIVTPSARTMPPKVRALVDLLHEFVASRPDVFDSVVPRKRAT